MAAQNQIPKKLNPRGRARRRRQREQDIYESTVEAFLGVYPWQIERAVRETLKGGRRSQ